MLSNGMQCAVNEITREDLNQNTRTCIDHLFVRNNKTSTHIHAAVIKTNIADHYSLFCCLEEEELQGSPINFCQGPTINNFKVNQQISETDWNNMIQQNLNANALFNKIQETFCEIYEKSKDIKKIKKKRSPNQWISDELIKCCNDRDKLYKKWCNNRNNKEYEFQYKQFRNSLNKKLKNTKNNYYRMKFIENRNNMKVTWELINEIIGKKSNNIDETILKNFKNINLENILKNFSINFNANVQNIIHKCDTKTIDLTQTPMPNTIYIRYASEEEIFNILSSLNTKKPRNRRNTTQRSDK